MEAHRNALAILPLKGLFADVHVVHPGPLTYMAEAAVTDGAAVVKRGANAVVLVASKESRWLHRPKHSTSWSASPRRPGTNACSQSPPRSPSHCSTSSRKAVRCGKCSSTARMASLLVWIWSRSIAQRQHPQLWQAGTCLPGPQVPRLPGKCPGGSTRSSVAKRPQASRDALQMIQLQAHNTF